MSLRHWLLACAFTLTFCTGLVLGSQVAGCPDPSPLGPSCAHERCLYGTVPQFVDHECACVVPATKEP